MFCTFLMSHRLLRWCHLAGQGGAQAVSSWAFCLQGHRVGLSVGVVGSPPRQVVYHSYRTWTVVRVGCIICLSKLVKQGTSRTVDSAEPSPAPHFFMYTTLRR